MAILVTGGTGYIGSHTAVELIEAGETASSAAYRVGFGDYSSFYRAYVKIIGEPPTTPKKKKTV